MTGNSLTAPQQQVLSMLSSGSTIQSAAEAVGVHRNTIANWRRSLPAFRESWTDMLDEQAIFWRDHLTPLATLSFQNIEQILTDPKTPVAVRLRASLAIVKQVITTVSAPPKRPATKDHATEALLNRFADSPSPYAYRPDARPGAQRRAPEFTPKPAPAAISDPGLCTKSAPDAQSAQRPAPPPPASDSPVPPKPASAPPSTPREPPSPAPDSPVPPEPAPLTDAELVDLLENFISPPPIHRN